MKSYTAFPERLLERASTVRFYGNRSSVTRIALGQAPMTPAEPLRTLIVAFCKRDGT